MQGSGGEGDFNNPLSHRHSRISSLLFLLLFSRVLLDWRIASFLFSFPRGTIVIPSRGKNRYSGKRLLAAHAIRGALMHRVWTGRAFLSSARSIVRTRSRYAALFLRAHKTSALCSAKQCLAALALTCGRTSEDSWLASLRELLLRWQVLRSAADCSQSDQYGRRIGDADCSHTHIKFNGSKMSLVLEGVIQILCENYRWLSKSKLTNTLVMR